MRKRAGGNGTKKRPARNGEAAADDLEAMFRAINTPRPGPAAPDPADEAGQAAALAALADGSLLAGGVANLERLGRAISSGALDGPEVGDAGRKRIVEFLGARLLGGSPAEKAAAAGALDAVMARPGARAVPSGAAPPASLADGSEPAPGAAAPLDPVSNGAAAPPGRSRGGRFARGNSFGLGNGTARRMAALRAALFQDLDGDRLRLLGQRLFERALAGDLEATKLVLLYAVGKPRECPDADRLDLAEFQLLAAAPSLAALWLAANETVDVRFAIEIWKKLSAADPDAATTQLLNSVEAEPGRFAKDLDRARAARAGK
jgi:hypothetical protein